MIYTPEQRYLEYCIDYIVRHPGYPIHITEIKADIRKNQYYKQWGHDMEKMPSQNIQRWENIMNNLVCHKTLHKYGQIVEVGNAATKYKFYLSKNDIAFDQIMTEYGLTETIIGDDITPTTFGLLF